MRGSDASYPFFCQLSYPAKPLFSAAISGSAAAHRGKPSAYRLSPQALSRLRPGGGGASGKGDKVDGKAKPYRYVLRQSRSQRPSLASLS